MHITSGWRRATALLKRYWRVIAGLGLAAAALYVATALSDTQGRADLPLGYAVRMTCEDDPESYLWSGGCDRVAADIARTDKPSFVDLYLAFVRAHHTPIPSQATARQIASAPCDPGFDRKAALKGTRYILSPDAFADVCTSAEAEAVMTEIDARDRALLMIEREGLSWEALAAGAMANLTEPLVLFAAAAVAAALWIL
jgi:hypothetical protein